MLPMKRRRPIISLLLVSLLLASAGCGLVQVIDKIDDPEPYFAWAYKRIAQLPHKQNRPAEKICLLIYEREEARLIRLTAPLDLIFGAKDCFSTDDGEEFTFSRNNWLEKFGKDEWQVILSRNPGLLLEVLTEDDRILIWLE